MKEVVYKGSILARNSDAYVMWSDWQKAKNDRNKFQKKLDDHMKELDVKHNALLDRYK